MGTARLEFHMLAMAAGCGTSTQAWSGESSQVQPYDGCRTYLHLESPGCCEMLWAKLGVSVNSISQAAVRHSKPRTQLSLGSLGCLLAVEAQVRP